MPEATLVREESEQRITLASAVSVGDVWQLSGGEAAVYLKVAGKPTITAGAVGERGDYRTSGKYTFPLTAGVSLLPGTRCYWDHSANAVHYKPVNDRDFFLGLSTGYHGGGVCEVDLNKQPRYNIDIMRDGCLTVLTGTQALGGFGEPKIRGGARSIELTATSEVQKIDLLSRDGFALGANAIVEAVFLIPDDGAGTAADFNIGVANATHATDADAITEHIFLHLDANATAIKIQSKDTSTTVAATDTTKVYVQGEAVANRVEVWFDFADPADVQVFVNGENVLAATAFNLGAVASTLFLLCHLEKTSSADVYRSVIERLTARYSEQ